METTMMTTLRSLDQKRLGRVVVGVLGLAIAVGYLLVALTMPRGTESTPGPGLFPVGVGIAAIVISLLVVIEAVTSNQVSGRVDLPTGAQRRLVIAFFVLTAVFVVLLPFLGQYVTASLYMIVMLRILSPMSWWRVIVYGVVIACGLSWIFIELLKIPLPGGFW